MMVEAALNYAARGWYVFPCEPRGKRPIVAHGLHDATTNPDTIRGWWQRCPTANVAIRTGAISGIIVIDLDGPTGLASWDQIEAAHGSTPTLTATTGNGRHLYFAHPGEKVPNSAGKLGPGIDVRGDGGYVIAPPSVHSNGCRYDHGGGEVAGLIVDLVAEPVHPVRTHLLPVVAASRGERYAAAALANEVHIVSNAIAGTRNDTLNRSAFNVGQLVGAGLLDATTAISLLLGAALHAGLGDTEARNTIASGLQAGIANPRQVAQ